MAAKKPPTDVTQVRFLQAFAGEGFDHRRGDLGNLPTPEAKRLIGARIAIAGDTAWPPTRPARETHMMSPIETAEVINHSGRQRRR